MMYEDGKMMKDGKDYAKKHNDMYMDKKGKNILGHEKKPERIKACDYGMMAKAGMKDMDYKGYDKKAFDYKY